MTEYDAGAVALAFAAYLLGTWIGGRNERARHKDDLPQSKAALGDMLCQHIDKVRYMEKFSGMRNRYACVIAYGEREYIVSVESGDWDFPDYEEDENEDEA